MDKYLLIKNIFIENENKEKAESMANYMKNKFAFYGLSAPDRKKLYQQFLKDEKKNKSIDWHFLDLCYQDKYREFQYLVCDYLKAFKKYLSYDDIFKIEKYVRAKQWWDTIDCFDQIIGDIGLSDKRVNDLMLKWSVDDDFWLRRIAIDHQLTRKDKTDKELLKQIIINNLGSDEFFINKAIG